MPLTRGITVEEDVTMSLSTVISGLVAKYNISGRVEAKVLLLSIVGNVCLGVNDLIDASNLSIVEKATIRSDMKLLAGRAFRAKLGVVEVAEEE